MNEENRTRRSRREEIPLSAKLLTVQLFCSLIIILILFFISRCDGGISKNIKEFYKDIKATDMSVSEVLSTFKNTAKETFAPIEVPVIEKDENMGE